MGCAANSKRTTLVPTKSVTSKEVDLVSTILQVDGKTPLHYAAERGVQATVKALLDKEGSAVIPDWQGRLPHHLASGKIQILLLKEAEKQEGSSLKHRCCAVLLPVRTASCGQRSKEAAGLKVNAVEICTVLCYAVLGYAVLCFAAMAQSFAAFCLP